jgi:hypothetical protein
MATPHSHLRPASFLSISLSTQVVLQQQQPLQQQSSAKRRKLDKSQEPAAQEEQAQQFAACEEAVPMSVDKNGDESMSHADLVNDLDFDDDDDEDDDVEPEQMLQQQLLLQQQQQQGSTVAAVDVEDAVEEVTDMRMFYRNDVYQTLRQNENRFRVEEGYMEKTQEDVNHLMRSILIDWLVEVGEEYKLRRQTLYYTVNYIDRLLAEVNVSRTKLQLVGVTAMFVASKYEEIYPPSVDEFVDITDNTYGRDEVFRLEGMLLKNISFNLTVTSPFSYWPQYSAAAGFAAKDQSNYLAQYILELSLQEKSYNRFAPSLLACAAIAIARHCQQPQQAAWTPELQKQTGYELAELQQCVEVLFANYSVMCGGKHNLKAIKEKYGLSKNGKVSQLACPDQLLKV